MKTPPDRRGTETDQREQFIQFAHGILTEVETWPEWKRGLLRGPQQPPQPGRDGTVIGDQSGAAPEGK